MTPPISAGHSTQFNWEFLKSDTVISRKDMYHGRYDLGQFVIVDTNGSQKYEAGIDVVLPLKKEDRPQDQDSTKKSEGNNALKLGQYLKKLGINLKEGASLKDLAYSANFLQAKRLASQGNLPDIDASLILAGNYLPSPMSKLEFDIQKNAVLFAGATEFLKLSEQSRNKFLPELNYLHLRTIHAAAKYSFDTDLISSQKLVAASDSAHRQFVERMMSQAEEDAKKCFIGAINIDLLQIMEVSAGAAMPIDLDRLQKIGSSVLGNPKCKDAVDSWERILMDSMGHR